MKELILENITKQGFISRKFLNSNNLTEKYCYDLVYNKQKCIYCDEASVFITFCNGYKLTCSSKTCIRKLRKYRTQRTNMKKYGVKNVFQIPEHQEQNKAKMKRTNLERYGVENIFQSKEHMFTDGIHCSQTQSVNEKRNKTMFEKYGTIDPLSINQGRERGIAKCHSEEINIKRKITNNIKYGGDTPFSSKEFQQKIIDNRMALYGVENAMDIAHVQEIHRKACITRDIKRLNDIDENGLNSFQRVANNRINDIDENGLNSFQRVANNRINDIDENGLNSYHRACVKSKETNIKNGHWLPDSAKTDFELYYRKVWKYTNRNDLSILEHIEKRGHANKGKYHLDHRYSIFQGFKDCVPPEVIGSIHNLEMIIGRNNLVKGRKCSIELESLMDNCDKA